MIVYSIALSPEYAEKHRSLADFRAPSTETSMKTLFLRFVHDESGATAIEYGLIATLIALALITVLTSVGTKLSTTFNNVKTAL
jgi:pilus assembly protein Flp/PilA